MALVVKDRIKVTAAAPGTGNVTLGSAELGYQTFAAIGNNNSTYYAIQDLANNLWEVGEGVFTTSGPTLTRSQVLSNSAGNTSAINFTNAVEVFVTTPATKSVHMNLTDDLEIDGDVTFTSDNATDQVLIKNTNTGASAAPDLVLWRDSASPANADSVGRIDFRGEDDGSTARNYTSIESKIVNVAASTPTGAIHFKTLNASTSEADVLVLSGNTATFAGGVDAATFFRAPNFYTGVGSQGLVNTNTNDLKLVSQSGDTHIYMDNDLAVELYHNNAKKLETTSSGVTVTGGATLTGGHLTVANGYGISSVGGVKYIADSDNNAPAGGLIHNFYTDNGTTSAMSIAKSGAVNINSTGFYLKQDSSESVIRSESQPIILQTYASSAWNDRLTVTNSGNVGVGVSPSGARLHVDTAVAGYAGKFVNDNTATDANGILIQAGSAATEYALNVTSTDGNTSFMTVKGNGRVGISTTAPETNLHVNGNAAFKSGSNYTAYFAGGGAATLYHNGTQSLQTATSGAVNISGTVTSPIFNTGGGDLRADGNNLKITSQNGETHANFYNNGGIRLLHDNSPFLTSNAGSITLSNSNDTDDALIFLGANNRANLYSVDGSYVTLKNSGSSGNDDVISGTVDNQTYLYHNGSYTIRTESDGIRVVNSANANDGIVYLGNTYGYIYNDMSSAISIYNGSNDAVLFGNHNSHTYLYDDGSYTFRTRANGIQAYDSGNYNDGYVYLGNQDNTFIQNDYSSGFGIYSKGDWVLWNANDSYTYLYHDGTWKLRTESGGVRLNNVTLYGIGSHNLQLSSNNAQNMVMYAAGTGSNGLLLLDSGGNYPTQLYGDSAAYGFLNGAWGSWDIKKVRGGDLQFNNNSSYYLNPGSTTKINYLNLVGTLQSDGNAGTAGQVFTSNGGSRPTWQDAGGGAWEHVSFTNFSGASQLLVTVARGYYYKIEFHDHQVDHSSGQRRWEIAFMNESYGVMRNESNNYLDCQGFHLQYLNQSTGNWPWASGQADSVNNYYALYGQTNLCTEGENNPDYGVFEFFQADSSQLYTGDNNYCTFRLKSNNTYWGQEMTSVVKISGTNGAANTTINQIRIRNIWGNNFRMKVHVTRLKRS